MDQRYPFQRFGKLRIRHCGICSNILGDNLLGLQPGNEPDFYEKYFFALNEFIGSINTLYFQGSGAA